MENNGSIGLSLATNSYYVGSPGRVSISHWCGAKLLGDDCFSDHDLIAFGPHCGQLDQLYAFCIAARHYHHSESDRNNMRYSLWRTIQAYGFYLFYNY